jgi:hypothetical protein
MGRFALLLALSGCGVNNLSRDVYFHQLTAAEMTEAGDSRGAAAQLEQAHREQVRLQRRATNVPPTPYP